MSSLQRSIYRKSARKNGCHSFGRNEYRRAKAAVTGDAEQLSEKYLRETRIEPPMSNERQRRFEEERPIEVSGGLLGDGGLGVAAAMLAMVAMRCRGNR